MITISLVLLIIMVVALGYTTINLLRKVEKLEDFIDKQQDFIDSVRKEIGEADEHLAEIDQKGQFKSDDEIGWFFDEIKEIKSRLEKYTPI
jgi:cell division protein FtsL